MFKNTKLNSSAPALNAARDGKSKNIPESTPTTRGMRNRTAEHSLMPGFSNPLDDSKEPALKEGHQGRPVPIHPSTPSRAQRGAHVEGQAQEVLQSAARLGQKKPPVIDDKANGQTYDGGSRPVTTRD